MDEGVTSAGDYAFYNMSNISKVILPSTLRKIGNNTFEMCSNLKSLTIPASLEEVKPTCASGIENFTFLGEANEAVKTLIYHGSIDTVGQTTVYYSSDTFDQWLAGDPNAWYVDFINWVKQ